MVCVGLPLHEKAQTWASVEGGPTISMATVPLAFTDAFFFLLDHHALESQYQDGKAETSTCHTL
jgi:hypothetical protein